MTFNTVHALIDKKSSSEIKFNLSKISSVIELETENIVYKSISGHPDIFFCKDKDSLICAKNTPAKYLDILKTNNIKHRIGTSNLSDKYPHTAKYNAVIKDNYLIHNIKFTDDKIRENIDKIINVKQGYTRCNLLVMDDGKFFTSDKNILSTLNNLEINIDDKNTIFEGIYINPQNILLPGHEHGFIGGTCGIMNNTIVFSGSLRYIDEGNYLRNFISKCGYEILELADSPLFDCGSILFI